LPLLFALRWRSRQKSNNRLQRAPVRNASEVSVLHFPRYPEYPSAAWFDASIAKRGRHINTSPGCNRASLSRARVFRPPPIIFPEAESWTTFSSLSRSFPFLSVALSDSDNARSVEVISIGAAFSLLHSRSYLVSLARIRQPQSFIVPIERSAARNRLR